MIIEMFDQEFIELQKELMTGYHSKLIPILANIVVGDLDMRIAHVAAYCGVMLDGEYTYQDRMKLCGILRKKLILLRENPNNSVVIIN